MQNAELIDILYRVCMCRAVGESHLAAGSLAKGCVHRLVNACRSIMDREPAMLTLSGTFVVVGDLHGNVDDLLQIIGSLGYPPARSYLFLGDYVDRGSNSVEVLLTLYSLKVLFPEHIYLLRGNHECKTICSKYGFRDECATFFRSAKPYIRFCQSFTAMPVAAVLNGKVFCVHGGLSPCIKTLSDITEYVEKPPARIGPSIAEDLLWSDPSNGCFEFEESERRRVGYLFGSVATDNFLSDNDLSVIIRGHEFCEAGAHWTSQGCLTIFSASDYCGRGNSGAVALVGEPDRLEIFPFRKYAPEARPRLMQLPQWFLESGVAQEPYIEDEKPQVWISI
jgi:diadenosine tetraphosphatase ApaH/serine/threonine PP2A family protein phosphatase